MIRMGGDRRVFSLVGYVVTAVASFTKSMSAFSATIITDDLKDSV